jgi:hypothetical protein
MKPCPNVLSGSLASADRRLCENGRRYSNSASLRWRAGDTRRRHAYLHEWEWMGLSEFVGLMQAGADDWWLDPATHELAPILAGNNGEVFLGTFCLFASHTF